MKPISLVILTIIWININAQNSFISVKDGRFRDKNQSYVFLGTNYWYGPYLASDYSNNGQQRLCSELDFLKSKGVTNLRVLLSGEGDATYPYRITPAVQELPYLYRDTILRSFDIFLNEASKRGMRVVCVLNNNWEWSGGFGQYLEWAGYSPVVLPKTPNWNWDHYCEFISQFYTCSSCQKCYKEWIYKVITRKNSITNNYYYNDTTIMAWQLANEPRPMTIKAKPDYKEWISSTAKYIKQLDSNHLLSIGVEGIIGTSLDMQLFEAIHSFKNIDYATIHLWPKTWNWYDGIDSNAIADSTLVKSKNYIQLHSQLCKKMNKPLVIEEFGLHRDKNKFTIDYDVKYRNIFFQYLLNLGEKYDISGYNFWGSFGYRDNRLTSNFWKMGLPYSADPPQEEQGLYGVFMTDTSTWDIIKEYNLKK